jgi:hypothetical protein
MHSSMKIAFPSALWLCAAGAVSAILWFLWVGNIEYVQARGAVGGLVLFQSLCVAALVAMVRHRKAWARIGILFLLGQAASMLSDWVWTIALDAERGWKAIEFVQSSPISYKAIFVVFGSWILLGGIQALLIDAIWRLWEGGVPTTGQADAELGGRRTSDCKKGM